MNDELRARLRNHYRDAVLVQNACNLSGVAHTLSRIMPDIREELASAGGYSTNDVNEHPIVQLFVSKMHDLAGLGMSDQGVFEHALRICEERGEVPGKVDAG